MTVFLILLAIFVAGLMAELIAARRAPFGYQDECGFHFGADLPETSEALKLENPS